MSDREVLKLSDRDVIIDLIGDDEIDLIDSVLDEEIDNEVDEFDIRYCVTLGVR